MRKSVRVARLCMALATGSVAASCGGDGDAVPGNRPPTRLQVKELARITVRGEPGEVVAGFGSLWAISVDQHVARIDPRLNRVVAEIKVAGSSIAIGAGAVWVADYHGNRVVRIDPTRNEIVATVPVDQPSWISTAAGAVWVASHHGGAVVRIDPSTNEVAAVVRVGPRGRSGPLGLTADGDAVWVGVPNLNAVVRIDAAADAVVAKVRLPSQVPPCGGLAAAGVTLWVTAGGCNVGVARIDRSTNELRDVLFKGELLSYGVEVGGPVVTDDAVWITKTAPTQSVLYRIDRLTGRRTARAKLSRGHVVAAFGFGSLWLVDIERGRIVRTSVSSPTAARTRKGEQT